MNALALEVKLALAIAAAVACMGLGYGAANVIKGKEIAELKADHAEQIVAATTAQAEAERQYRQAEQDHATALAVANTTYEEARKNDQARTILAISNLRSGIDRLRVSIAPAGATGAMPATDASTGGGDGQATATLSGPVAARLAGRYADYNEIVEQLTLCQATVVADRAATQPKQSQ